jgi:hypothetical protein
VLAELRVISTATLPCIRAKAIPVQLGWRMGAQQRGGSVWLWASDRMKWLFRHLVPS